MRIGTYVIALVLAAGTALAGCSVTVQGTAAPEPAAASAAPASGPAPSGDVFADTQGRFGLAPPAGWAVDTSGTKGTAVVFMEPQPAGSAAERFGANINVLVVQTPADLSATIAGARQELQGLSGYTSTADEAVTLHDGTPAHILGGTFVDSASRLSLRNVQLFTVHGGTAIVATGTSPADAWGSYGTVFDTSLRSLTVAHVTRGPGS
ncbi:hypothetical protein [Pseudonocardia sp.]|jgi:hypothetical protein|uniref:hypothetical protein n=1 Tax=Pseudonocardia sp. TaxID=60912 RepID=UPI0031FDBF1B